MSSYTVRNHCVVYHMMTDKRSRENDKLLLIKSDNGWYYELTHTKLGNGTHVVMDVNTLAQGLSYLLWDI